MKNFTLFLSICAMAALGPFVSGRFSNPVEASDGFEGWPSQWNGAPLRRLPLTWREEQFAEGFPGQIAHFSDGTRILLMRYTSRATRKLHPAKDCFRGSGFSVLPLPVQTDQTGALWAAFEASKGGERLRVTERIFEQGGSSWTDASTWYWSAAYGRSKGPWWAITIVEKI